MSEKRKVSLSSHLNNLQERLQYSQLTHCVQQVLVEQGGLAEQVMANQKACFILLTNQTIISQLQVIGVRGVVDNMVRVHTDNNENESAAGLDDHLGRCQQGLC